MEVTHTSSPFGGRSRTGVLLALKLLGSSYPRELARLLALPLSVVQKALRSLELDGLIAGRSVGRMRLYELNRAYFARRELQTYLSRLADADSQLKGSVASLRRRPRRSAKPS